MNAARDTILVVDDEVHMQALFKRVLGKENYLVEAASSGEEGIERLNKEWLDLVISDLRLPGMDGLEFIKKARELSPTIPCIMLTGYGTIQAAVAAIKEGAVEYLTKPVDINKVKFLVGKVLNLNRVMRE